MMPLFRTTTTRSGVKLASVHLQTGPAASGISLQRSLSRTISSASKDGKEPADTNTPNAPPQEPSQNKSAVTENKHKKTQAQLDEELRLKMEGMAGDGGESGVEYEDGKPVAMKRSVKQNMFRYI